MSICPLCQQSFDPSTAAYDDSGKLVCRTCRSAQAVAHSNTVVEAQDPTSSRNLYGAAASSSLLGVTTCCLSTLGFYFLLAPIPVFMGIGTLIHVMRDPTAKERLGTTGFALVLGLSVTGALFGFLAFAVGFFALALKASS